MSSLGSPNPFFIAGKKAYEVERSLRFNDNDSAELNKTFSSAGNRKKWTWSAWVKRANLNPSGTQQTMFSGGPDNNNFTSIGIYQDSLTYKRKISASNDALITTTQKLRDPSAWYHFVVYEDAANTVTKFYINGVEVTDFSSSNQPSNVDGSMNTNQEHAIGNAVNTTELFDGYMAEINFIDGQAYNPSYFGKTDATTGQWNPKKYTGSYGTNGFYLNFSTNTLGTDRSGNGNDFTPNNFSVVAGAGNDALSDTPTNNFCTLNSVKKDGQTTLSNGNLQASGSQTSTYNINTQGTFAQSSGKWYYEVEFTSGSGSCAVGWARTTLRSSDNPTTGGGIVYRPTNGDYIDLAGNNPLTPPTTSTGTVIQVAIDFDAGKIWFGSGGTYFSSGDPSAGSNEAMTFTGGSELLAPVVRTMAATFNFNFGQRAFSYTVPTGYQSLCSANLPDPVIKLPNQHFNTLLYTGDGSSTRTLTGVGFQPDWTWKKERNQAYSIGHMLYDSVRGLGVDKHLDSSTTAAEGSGNDAEYGYFTGFTSDGFSVSAGSSGDDYVNDASNNYVTWNWNAGDTDGKTYTVKVVSDSGNKYRFDDFGTSAVTLDLAEGGTYIFDQSDSSNAGHPLRFSTTSNGTHGGGTEYTTGVTTAGTPGQAGAYTQIVVAASAPTLYYYCSVHSGMGGQANTNSTLGSSNFDGSTQSTVKVNATAGFSITKYTGTGSTATIGHGLGVAPDVLIVKNRDDTNSWNVYHAGNAGATPAEDFVIYLDQTSAKVNQSSNWNDTAPTSSVFTVGSSNGSNGSSDDMIAYCFSEVAGYSKFGSYTGNGNADGTFVFTGFRPAWVLIKRIDYVGNWWIHDAQRNTFNVVDNYLYADTSAAEASFDNLDFLSNGFKLRLATYQPNTSGGTFIYFAFAESSFKNARAR